MKRFLAAILSVCLLSSATVSGFFSAYAEGAESSELYRSERISSDDKGKLSEYEQVSADELILPSSYEQYLPLSEPSDVSVTENYTAIADGSRIYVYDRRAGEYRCYEHTANEDESNNKITKLQFSETGELYFLDVSLFLYSLDPVTLESEKTSLTCNTFTIFSDTVYFTNVSQILRTTLDKLDSSTAESVVSDVTSKAALAQDNGVLYYTDAGKYLRKIDSTNDTLIGQLTSAETVVSLAVYSGILYYTDTAKTLYVYDLTTNEQLNSFEGGYSALSVSDGYIYAVNNDSVRQYSPADAAFTDFEICASSSSQNRLSGASDTILVGDKLLFADNGNNRIAIITGPNMAGKSTYMRQTALIVLMAQIGSFVPADEANIGICDRIFTRVGASDDLASGQSTFMVEMTEVANILRNATKNSLLVLDEIGRGTSTFDGLSIAWAVIEHISNPKILGAKTLFATHYHELTELEGTISGVNNYCIAVKEQGDDIVFLRKIVKGGADKSYGIQVAKLAGVPEPVIARAKELVEELASADITAQAKEIAQMSASPQHKAVAKPDEVDLNQMSIFDTVKDDDIIKELGDLELSSMTPIDALNTLYRLQTKLKNRWQ